MNYERCAERPLRCLTVSLYDRFAERLIQHLRLYQSDSERSERSFVFQREARSDSRQTVLLRKSAV